jgi:hypothetical protein
MRYIWLLAAIILVSGCNKKGVEEEVVEHTAEVAGDIIEGDVGEAAKDLIQGVEDVTIDIQDGDAKHKPPVATTMSLTPTTKT